MSTWKNFLVYYETVDGNITYKEVETDKGEESLVGFVSEEDAFYKKIILIEDLTPSETY